MKFINHHDAENIVSVRIKNRMRDLAQENTLFEVVKVEYYKNFADAYPFTLAWFIHIQPCFNIKVAFEWKNLPKDFENFYKEVEKLFNKENIGMFLSDILEDKIINKSYFRVEQMIAIDNARIIPITLHIKSCYK